MTVSNTPEVATTEVTPEAVELTATQLDQVSGGNDKKPPPPPQEFLIYKMDQVLVSSS